MNKRYTAPEIKQILKNSCVNWLDPRLAQHNFTRRKNSLVYSRTLADDVCQAMEMFFLMPRYSDDYSIAHIEPYIRITMPVVGQVALEMVGHNVQLLDGRPEMIVNQNIGLVGPMGSYKDWSPVNEEDFAEQMRQLADYSQQWVIPFLNEYTTPMNITIGYERRDERTPNDLTWLIHVAAAYLLTGKPSQAKQVIMRRFDKPGFQDTHGALLDYVRKLPDDSG